MQTIKKYFQMLEWIILYALLPPAKRRRLAREYSARRGGESGGKPAVPRANFQEPPGAARLRLRCMGQASPRGMEQVWGLPGFSVQDTTAAAAVGLLITSASLCLQVLPRVDRLQDVLQQFLGLIFGLCAVGFIRRG